MRMQLLSLCGACVTGLASNWDVIELLSWDIRLSFVGG